MLSISEFTNLPELAAQVVFHIYHHHQTISLPPLPKLNLDNPQISQLVRFCNTVLTATRLTATCVILALHYMSRLAQQLPIPSSQQRQMGSEIRLFTIALHLSDSFLNDSSYTIKSWSEASGLPIHEIATMQREALCFLQWDLNISPSDFYVWVGHVKSFSDALESKQLTHELQLHLSNSHLSRSSYPLPSPPISPQPITQLIRLTPITRPIRLTPVQSRQGYASIIKPQRQKIVHRIDMPSQKMVHRINTLPYNLNPLTAVRHSIAQVSQLSYFDFVPLTIPSQVTNNFLMQG